jgi:hypothetical protein
MVATWRCRLALQTPDLVRWRVVIVVAANLPTVENLRRARSQTLPARIRSC